MTWSGATPSREGAGAAAPLPPGTLRISALAEKIEFALKAAFPRRLWVVGETSELERSVHRPHWFFKLVEKEASDGKRYALGAVIWAFDQKRLFGPGGTLHGIVEPRDGIEIRAQVDIDFYGPNGDLRLVVRDIDPAFTLGKLALERQQLIEKLTKEGGLARQKALGTPALPLRIGLITSANSAAYNDFVKELARFGFATQVLFFDARMQGEDTVSTVRRGLKALVRRGVDLIALVRGGGSTVDLAWFDKEKLVRAIADCPVPVLTGIGHEIDTSVADLAAHLYFKTPTALAAWLNERCLELVSELREARRRLTEIGQRPGEELEELSFTVRRLADLVLALVREQEATLEVAGIAVARVPSRNLALESERASNAQRRFRAATYAAITSPLRIADLLRQRFQSLPLLDRTRQHGESLERARSALDRGLAELLRRAGERLALAEARTRLLDPTNVVRRGFAILRTADGRTLKDAAAARPGDKIHATLRDGEIAARVESSPAGDLPRVPAAKKKRGADHGEEEDGSHDGPRQLAFW